MLITKSTPLTQAEVPALFRAAQDFVIAHYNNDGIGCAVRPPSAQQLAGIKTPRQLEALVWTCTRPLT